VPPLGNNHDDATTNNNSEPFVAPKVHLPDVEVQLELAGCVLDEASLGKSGTWSYLVMLVRLLEGVTVSRTELLAILRGSMRQRSIGRVSRREYVLRYLNEHPPPGEPNEPIGRTNES
jgi:hypothetical protein